MSTHTRLNPGLRAAGVASLLLLLAVPALAGEIYTWRTEDGTTAFTDDAKAIPARYRAQVKTREAEGIEQYNRYTGPKPGAQSDYAERLAARLEHLRALNDHLYAPAAPTRPVAQPSVALNTQDLTIDTPTDGAAAEPTLIQKFRTQYPGEEGTRHDTAISRGGKVLTVVKGERHVGGIDQRPAGLELLD